MNGDIFLNSEEKKKVISLLKRTKFEDLEIHPHYYNKYGKPRHGVTIEKTKEIYYQFSKIISVFKRRALKGFKHTFVYKISKGTSYYLMFFLDEKPIKVFNAISTGSNIEKRLMKKYFGFSK